MSFLTGAIPASRGMGDRNPNPHRPGRDRKIDAALNIEGGRPSEIVNRLVESLGRGGVNAILNNSNGADPRINEEVLVLVRTVRDFIRQDEQTMVTTIKSKNGFERTNLLNATPIRYLVKIYNYLIDQGELILATELERAIERNPSSKKYRKQTVKVEEYTTGIKLSNGVEETGRKVITKYISIATN